MLSEKTKKPEIVKNFQTAALITRFIVINIVPLAELFCNCPLFVGLVWLTSGHMFGSGNFWDKSPSWILNVLKMSSFYTGNFKFFKNALGQFIPNRPPKHMITSTNHEIDCSWYCTVNGIIL